MNTKDINKNLWEIFALLNTKNNSKHGFRIVGDELLCKTKEQAEVIADFFEDLGFDYVRTGYYDPEEDTKENCVDKYTGWYYVDFD